jgi:hypothetical protein
MDNQYFKEGPGPGHLHEGGVIQLHIIYRFEVESAKISEGSEGFKRCSTD